MNSGCQSQASVQIPISHQRFHSQEFLEYNPIDLPNKFLFDRINRQKFLLFLEGQYSAERLVQDMNAVIRDKRLSKEEAQSRKYVDRLQQQLIVKQRYNVIKDLIQKNIKLKESMKVESNLKNSRLFQNINQHCDDHVAKIVSRDLLTERTDGTRIYDKIKYRNYNGIKVNTNCKQPQEQSEEQYSKHVAEIDLRKEVQDYFERMDHLNYIKEQKQKRKARLKILSERKYKTHFFEFDSNKQYAPSIKDVRLYNYIHNQDGTKALHQFSRGKKLSEHSNNSHKFHALANFKNHPKEIVTEDFDQSYESIKEMKLSSLYGQSRELQSKLINERRLVNKLTHSKQLDALANEIQVHNYYKLT